MKVLIVGSGGREHALAWKASRCQGVEKVFVAPGNAGTAGTAGVENVALGVSEFDALVAFAKKMGVGLTIVGPEAPLVAGIVDYFEAAGLVCFGPSAVAARLEGSKVFSKDFLTRHGIPTASYRTFDNLAAAEAYIHARGAPLVVKADGLAAGKGVVVAELVDDALKAVRDLFGASPLGRTGQRVVIEDFLVGEEASFIVVADGERCQPFATSQDHKRIGEGDRGPNTGGMGAYSPAPVVTPAVAERVLTRIVRPTLAGMVAEGAPYRGFLYVGLMIDAAGEPHVVEFNCRFGDPEAQPVLARLETDLVQLCLQAAQGRLEPGAPLAFDVRAALGVVLAADGYPGSYPSGDQITGLDRLDEHALLFHAGTALDAAGRLVTNGGRVLCVVGMGASVTEAAMHAYRGVRRISFAGAQYRGDIGHRAIAREKTMALAP